MGWASGFQAGSQVAQRALDAYEKSQKRYAYDQALKGVGVQEINAPLATEQQAAAANAETQALAAQDAQEFGLGAPEQYTQRQAGEATAPTRYSLAGQTYDQRPSQDMVGLARTEALAQATERFDPLEAQRLRAIALQMKGQIAEQAYNEQYRPLQLQKVRTGLTSDQLAIEEAQRKAAADKAKLDARSALADWSKKNDGKQPTLAAIQSIASQFNIPATEFLTERDAANTLEYKELKRDFGKAVTAGVSGMNTFLASRFDPDATDNISPQVVQDPKTKAYVVMYGDRVLSEYGSHKSFQALAASVQGMIDNDPLSTVKTLADIEAKKASTAASNASAQYSKALAGNVGADPTAKKIAAYEAATGRKATPAELDRFYGVGPKVFDPAAYATVLKTFTEGGMSPATAKIEADALFGRSRVSGEVDYGALAKQKADKGKGGVAPPPANGAADAPSTAPAPVAARPASSSFAQNQQQRAQLEGLSAQTRAIAEATRQARTVLGADARYAQLQEARTQAIRAGDRQLANKIDTKLQEIESAVAQRFLPR